MSVGSDLICSCETAGTELILMLLPEPDDFAHVDKPEAAGDDGLDCCEHRHALLKAGAGADQPISGPDR